MTTADGKGWTPDEPKEEPLSATPIPVSMERMIKEVARAAVAIRRSECTAKEVQVALARLEDWLNKHAGSWVS